MRAVGSSIPRFDARSKVTGEMPYPGDFNMPDQLHMKILWPDRPHARITKYDTARALAAPGVVAVFGADDVPVNEYGLIMPDQEVLVGRVGGVVRCLLDQVALVMAETEDQAEAALKLIDIEYEDLPGVYSVAEAMAPDAPIVHPEKGDSNVLHAYKIRYGDVDDAFAQADVIIEDEYSTHPQEHAYLQPEAGVAFVRPDGKIEVIVGGQWMHEDREQVAHSLGLPDRTGRDPLSRHRRRVWRTRGHERADRAGSGRLEAGTSGENAVDARRIDSSVITNATPASPAPNGGRQKMAGLSPSQIDVSTDAGAYAYTSTKGVGQSHPGLRRPLRHPQRLG